MLPSPGQFCFVLFCFVRALVPGSLNCSEFRSSGLPVPPDLGFEEAPSRASGMEHCYLRQPISRAEAVPERRSRLWQMDAPLLPLPPRTEVLCPQPRRAARIPFAVSVNKAIPSALPPYRPDSACDILDLILSKNDSSDGADSSSGQAGFLCGSPPVRANNPVVHDPQFGKRAPPSFSPLGSSSHGKLKVEAGSPSCGVSSSSPKVRIEGFACGNSETHYAVTPLLV